MPRRFLPFFVRSFAVSFIIISLVFCSDSIGANVLSAAPQQAAPKGPRIWLNDGQGVLVRHVGATDVTGPLVAGQAAPLSVTSADVDEDGVADLLVGYGTPNGGVIAVQRGNLAAFAPQGNTALMAVAAGNFPSPFLPTAQVFNVPVTPDFVAVGNFTGKGHTDVVVAARGESSLYLLAGDGKGNFAAPQAVALPGTLTTLAAGILGRPQQFTNLLAGVTHPQAGSSLLVFQGTQQGLVTLGKYPVGSPVTAVAYGDLDGDSVPDAAVLAGGQVSILNAASMNLDAVSLPVSAVSIALGSFVHDRDPRVQMALLTSDGTVHIAVHNSFDARAFTSDEIRVMRHAALTGQPNPLATAPVANEGWRVVESFASAAPITPGQTPVMFATRVSSNASDDVMVLNPGLSQMAVISHANLPDGAATFVPGQLSTRPYSGSAVAAVSARVNIDGRPGVVAVHQGQIGPSVLMPLPDPTFTVNTTNDTVSAGACAAATPGQCSLREAILEANAAAGVDTIILPAGTYTLTRTNASPTTGENAASTGDLDITDGVNIQGAGSAATIIQAGTTNANGIDKVLSINPNFNTAMDVSISGVTVRFGHNQTSFATDGCGGGFDWEASATGTLTVTDVVVTDNKTDDGDGGGICLTNTPGGTGHATIANSIFQNNTVFEATTSNSGLGGGIFAGIHTSFSVTNSSILNNLATQNVGSAGAGGGVYIFGPSGGGGQTAFHNVTISGNQSKLNGGGIHTGAGILIDTGSVISGNSSGDGAGLWSNVSAETTTVTKSTISGNTATGNGGGVRVDTSTPNNFSMSFSRIAGNSAAAGSGLSNAAGTVTATNNWWGTNTPATTIAVGSPAAVFDPFIVLTHTASPATIRTNQSTTLTGDMSKDNHGSGVALAGNLDVIAGLPITFNNAVDGSIPQAQPETLNASAQATATFNAGGVAGGGKADATVDQATVTANIVVLEPLQITKSFIPTTVATSAASTMTLSVNNPNVIAVDASFTDTFPANLVVAATPGVTNICGGTVTAVAGAGSVSFSNATLPVGTCSITVNVSSAVDSVYNNSVTINSTAAGTGLQSTSSASLTVISPPAITKAFGAASITLNGTTSLTFTLNSNNANLTLNGVAFTDNLPAGLVVATPGNLTSSCSGTATAIDGAGSISLAGASLASAASCTISVNVQGTTAGVKNNSVQVSSSNGGTGNTSNASITVVAPPVIIKAFGAASIALNGSTTLTFTIQNNNTTSSLSGIGFSDTLPSGLVVSTPNGLTGTCGGGTITATAAAGVISLSGASLAQSTSCTFSVNVTGTAPGTQNNTTGNVTSTEGGTGGTASASINVIASPPSINKSFGAASIPLNGSTSLTFSITNPNPASLSGVAFTDNLPAGLVVATPNGLSNTCGGTVTAVAGSGSVSLSAGTLAASTPCSLAVNVTGTTAGVKNNTVQVTATGTGPGNTSNASITVVAPPVIIKAFGAASIPLNGSTSLSFTIQNSNTTASLSGIGFSDTLPTGVVVASPNGLTGSCGGGTITATAATNVVSLNGATLAQSTSCTFSVNVTGTAGGTQNNTTGNVTSTEGGTGGTASASINVVAPPSIAKAFGAAGVALNGTTSLAFTITNPAANAVAENGVAFTDTLPAGLVVATPNGLTSTCGGTATAVAGSGSISLTGGTIAQSSNCTVTVNITATATGSFVNTTGNVTSTNGGTGNTATASLSVATPPTITKTFGALTIPLNGSTSLSFAITNPAANAIPLTGLAFTDNLPAGLVVATPNGLASTCGGTSTAVAGAGSVSLAGGTLAANSSCTVTVNVTGTTGGIKNNSVQITATESGTGNTSNATITVTAPPVIIKAFGAASIPVSGSTSLTFTIQNNNATSGLTGIGFPDTLPAGLVVATPNGQTGTCGGGTITAVAASGSISLSAASLAASTSCSFVVNVTGTTAGTKNNTTGNVTSTEGGIGGTASASINVVGPPTIAKAFSPAAIAVNGTSALTITITNPAANAVAETGVAVTDNLPAGMVVATPNGLTNTCGGTATATAGSSTVSLTGGTIAAASNCAVTVNVTASANGSLINTTAAVSSTNGGTGGTATATLTVQPADLTITKTHAGTFARGQTGANWTITVTNSGAGPTVGTVTVVDTLPSVANPPVPTAISGTGWTCTLATLTCTRSDALAPGASYPAITLSVNIPINIQNNFTNTATVSGGGETNTGNDTASDAINLGPPINITPHAGNILIIKQGGSGSLVFDVTDTDPNPSIISFSCTGLPAGSACTFSPSAITAAAAAVTMTITTTGNSAGIGGFGNRGDWTPAAPVFALLFPVLGIVLAVSLKKDRRRTLRLLPVFAVTAIFLALAGCGGSHRPATPLGTYTVTVTAVTPSAQGTPVTATTQASTTITLTVQ